MSSNNSSTSTLASSNWQEPLFLTSSSLGLLSSLLSLFLIAVTRAYRRFGHRVLLYYAVASGWLSVGHFLNLADVRDRDAVLYWLSHFSYGILVCSLLLLWVGTSVFATTFCGVQVLREKEKFIVVVVAVLPLLVSWIPSWSILEFQTNLNATWKASSYLRGGSAGFTFVAGICALAGSVSSVALGAATAMLCRSGYCRRQRQRDAPNHITQSLKSIVPVFVLGIWTQLVVLTLVIVFPFTPSDQEGRSFGWSFEIRALFVLTPSISVVLLVILIVDLFLCRRTKLKPLCSCCEVHVRESNKATDVARYIAEYPDIDGSTQPSVSFSRSYS
eukprot:Em0008g881a